MQIIDNTKLVANWVNVKKLNENQKAIRFADDDLK